MRFLVAAGLLAGLAGCASDSAMMGETSASASTSGSGYAAPPTTDIEGLAVRFFQCENGAAFTTQRFPDGRFRVTTRDGTYDMESSGAGFAGGGATYRRDGVNGMLEGAAGGPYVNCVQR